MINIAVIGTNWISEKFIQAAQYSNQFQLSAIYSRQLDSAKSFAKEYQASSCSYYDNLDELGADQQVDAVYIASPNSLHCEQAILMMEQGKHVICEKPLASNIDQVKRMYEVAKENNVVLFEAFKTEFLPNFEELKMRLASIGTLRSVHLSYCQYSSRYQKYLNGENPNTFNPAFSNGSIMDIGFYSVAAAISLFGKPDKVQASAKLLDSGVDGHGTVIFEYPNFIVSIQHSKVSDGNIASEIQGEDGFILIKDFSECTGFVVQRRDGNPQSVSVEQEENSMIYEAIAFAEQVRDGVINQAYMQRSLEVAEVLTDIRRQTGVVFPADK